MFSMCDRWSNGLAPGPVSVLCFRTVSPEPPSLPAPEGDTDRAEKGAELGEERARVMAAKGLKPARGWVAAQLLGKATVALLRQGAAPHLAGRECEREGGDAQPASGLLLDGAVRVLQRLVERGQVALRCCAIR